MFPSPRCQGMTAYSASKAGVIGLAKAVGKVINIMLDEHILSAAGVRGDGHHGECAGAGRHPHGSNRRIASSRPRAAAMVDAMDPKQVTYMTDKIPMKRCDCLRSLFPSPSFNPLLPFPLCTDALQLRHD